MTSGSAGSASSDANLISGPAYCQERVQCPQMWSTLSVYWYTYAVSIKYSSDFTYTLHILLHNIRTIYISIPFQTYQKYQSSNEAIAGSPWCSLPRRAECIHRQPKICVFLGKMKDVLQSWIMRSIEISYDILRSQKSECSQQLHNRCPKFIPTTTGFFGPKNFHGCHRLEQRHLFGAQRGSLCDHLDQYLDGIVPDWNETTQMAMDWVHKNGSFMAIYGHLWQFMAI